MGFYTTRAWDRNRPFLIPLHRPSHPHWHPPSLPPLSPAAVFVFLMVGLPWSDSFGSSVRKLTEVSGSTAFQPLSLCPSMITPQRPATIPPLSHPVEEAIKTLAGFPKGPCI